MIKPINDRIVIKADEVEEVTKSGIVLSSGSAEKPCKGTVVAIGEGKRNAMGVLFPLSVSVGDRVVFSKYAGTPVTLDDREYLVIKEEEILGIL